MPNFKNGLELISGGFKYIEEIPSLTSSNNMCDVYIHTKNLGIKTGFT